MERVLENTSPGKCNLLHWDGLYLEVQIFSGNIFWDPSRFDSFTAIVICIIMDAATRRYRYRNMESRRIILTDNLMLCWGPVVFAPAICMSVSGP